MADQTENEQSPEQGAPESGAPKKRLPLAAIAIVAGLAIGGGAGAMVLGPMAASALGFTGAPVADSTGGDHAAEGEGEQGEGGPADGVPVVYTLDNLVLNPAGSGGARFLLLTVTFEAVDAAASTAMQARDAELRDVVLSTLSHKTVEELVDVARRDSIKTELVDAVNARFGDHGVKRLYFPQYVVQ